MGAKVWFLVQFVNGRFEIVSEAYDTLEDARKVYEELHGSAIICETIYG